MKEYPEYFVEVPEAFAMVEDGVYRCSGVLTQNQIKYLDTLNLKTVVILSVEGPSRLFAQYVRRRGIQKLHLGMTRWQSNLGWKPVSEELIKEALQSVLDKTNHPLLIVCSSGVRETGTLVGCLRKLQHWNFNSIVYEVRVPAKHCDAHVVNCLSDINESAMCILVPKLRRRERKVHARAVY
ncbi:hypothetical protein FBU59_004934 [Linderina macrospora]|uniref:Uncharacterized protein n=1 Tax=Linderina macrospora TaxID=4868 RepID=A0ACC1J4B9_9FUNG|nr:hypothetical protein FBU59_004934 [Linderina macrospora]